MALRLGRCLINTARTESRNRNVNSFKVPVFRLYCILNACCGGERVASNARCGGESVVSYVWHGGESVVSYARCGGKSRALQGTSAFHHTGF